MALLPLIFSLAVFPLVASAQPWYAVFYNNTLKANLKSTWQSSDNVTANDLSTVKTECDHTTIAFNPAANLISDYDKLLTTIQSVHVLGYAHDEHGQAILLRYDGGQNITINTQNSFPHTTISHQNQSVYTAVYSNDLWARVNASGAVNITFRGGFPDTLSFTNTTAGTVNQTFELPAITLGNKTYTATTVFVYILDPATAPVYTGTFCSNSGWDLATNVCSFPATASPTTPAPTGNATNAPNTTTTPTTPVPTGNTTNPPTVPPKNDATLHGMSMVVAALIVMLAFF